MRRKANKWGLLRLINSRLLKSPKAKIFFLALIICCNAENIVCSMVPVILRNWAFFQSILGRWAQRLSFALLRFPI